MNLEIFAIIALHTLTWFSQISQALLSIAEYTLVFMAITNTKANASLGVEYPPPYKRHVWDYATADVGRINKAISQFNWQ